MAAFDCAMIPIRDRRVLSNALDGSERTEAGLAISTQKISLLKWWQLINNGRGTIDYHYVCTRVLKVLSQGLKWLTRK